MSSNNATPPQAPPPKSPAASGAQSPTPLPRPRRKRPFVFWLLLAILAGGVLWISVSDGPVAQEARELAGVRQDRAIIDSTFSVGPHTFRYYKFSLPEGTAKAFVVGEFKSTAARSTATFAAAGDHTSPEREKDSGTNKAGTNTTEANNAAANPAGPSDDNSIEVYVLTESAFAVWQTGYATSSLYDSGNVAQSNALHADIPAGAGIYYLVFSNKSDPKTPKAVHATVLLRYESWLPDWLRRWKTGFSDRIGAQAQLPRRGTARTL